MTAFARGLSYPRLSLAVAAITTLSKCSKIIKDLIIFRINRCKVVPKQEPSCQKTNVASGPKPKSTHDLASSTQCKMRTNCLPPWKTSA